MSFLKMKIPLYALMGLLVSCGSINDSWESKGGGYLKYTIDDEGPFTIELGKNDVEPPFYVNNSHSYFYLVTRPEESKQGHQISLLVNRPTTAGNLKPVVRASGISETVTWFKQNGNILTKSSRIPCTRPIWSWISRTAATAIARTASPRFT